MGIGKLLHLIAAIALFLGGIGSSFPPNPTTWGLFCIALGLFLEGYNLGLRRRS